MSSKQIELYTITTDCARYSFTFDSYITGHHVYNNIWTPQLEEFIPCENEPQNICDRNAVRLFIEYGTIGHVPPWIAPYCAYRLLNGGTILKKKWLGRGENRRRNGHEVPCTYFVKGFISLTLKAGACIFDFIEREKTSRARWNCCSYHPPPPPPPFWLLIFLSQ